MIYILPERERERERAVYLNSLETFVMILRERWTFFRKRWTSCFL